MPVPILETHCALQVSAELKSTLETEIGLDEIRSELTRPPVPAPRPAGPPPAALAPSSSGEAAEVHVKRFVTDLLEWARPSCGWVWHGSGRTHWPHCPTVVDLPVRAPPAVDCMQEPALTQLAASMQAGIRPMKEDMAMLLDPDIERKRAGAAAMAWGGAAPPAGDGSGGGSSTQASPQQPPAKAGLEAMSVEELEAELQVRSRPASVAGGHLRPPPTPPPQ